MKKIAILWLSLIATGLGAQNPQTQNSPVFAANAKYVNGVAPGYWPTQSTIGALPAAAGLTLNIGAGTTNCSGSMVTSTDQTLTMTASTTNYVYLNTASSCVAAVKTTAFASSDIPLATVVTGSSSITTIVDDRTQFIVPGSGGGGVNPGTAFHVLQLDSTGHVAVQTNITSPDGNALTVPGAIASNNWRISSPSQLLYVMGPSIAAGAFGNGIYWVNGGFTSAYPYLLSQSDYALYNNATVYNAGRCNQTTLGAVSDYTTGVTGGCAGSITVPAAHTVIPAAVAAGHRVIFLLDMSYFVNDCQWQDYNEGAPPLTPAQSLANVERLAGMAYQDGAIVDFITSWNGWVPGIPTCAQNTIQYVDTLVSNGYVAAHATPDGTTITPIPQSNWFVTQGAGVLGSQLDPNATTSQCYNTDHIHPLANCHMQMEETIEAALRNRGTITHASQPGMFSGPLSSDVSLTVGATQSGGSGNSVFATINGPTTINANYTANSVAMTLNSSNSVSQGLQMRDTTASSVVGMGIWDNTGTSISSAVKQITIGYGNSTSPSAYVGAAVIAMNAGAPFELVFTGSVSDYVCGTGQATPVPGWFGIGDTTCTYPLSIESSSNKNAAHMIGIYNLNTGGYSDVQYKDATGTVQLTTGIGNSTAGSFTSQAFFYTNNSFPMIWKIGASQGMVLDASRNFGIGTNTTATSNAFFVTAAGATTASNLTDSALTSGHCVQASTAGLLTTTSGACGSSIPIRAGSFSISSATSVAVTFATAMSTTPTSCSLTPSASSATTGQPFATSLSTTGFTVNVPTSGTLAGTYLCTNNNAN